MTTHTTRRQALRGLAATAAVPFVTAPAVVHAQDARRDVRSGHLFMLSNGVAGNAVQVFARNARGVPEAVGSVPTEGLGTGGGLGSQGAVALATDGEYLFAVNAASNTVSTFAVTERGLLLTSVTPSGGLFPNSVAEHEGLVYVLNAGGSGNVAGFRNRRGRLEPLADGLRPLSAAGGTGAAQVGFDADGETLVVTERATNVVDAWPVRRDGSLGTRSTLRSPGATPFGFAITRRNVLVVSEAAGGAVDASSASSYRFGDRAGTLQLATGALPTGQTAACWVSVTPNARFAYTSNAGSSSISCYRINRDGSLFLVAGTAASTGANAGALDLAVTPNGRQLHVFASRARELVAFSIDNDGRLALLGTLAGLTAGSAGLAAN